MSDVVAGLIFIASLLGAGLTLIVMCALAWFIEDYFAERRLRRRQILDLTPTLPAARGRFRGRRR